MTTFAMDYDPTAGKTCACGNDIGCTFGELDGVGRCTDCVERGGWPREARLIEALDEVDSSLFFADEDARGHLLADTVRLFFGIAAARVPEGVNGPLLPDEEFVAELVRRGAQIHADQLFALVGLLAPDVTSDAFFKTVQGARRAAEHHAARDEAAVAEMTAGLLLLSRAPAGATLGQAVDALGIDFGRFSGALMAAAAQQGVALADLPREVIDGCITAARISGGTA